MQEWKFFGRSTSRTYEVDYIIIWIDTNICVNLNDDDVIVITEAIKDNNNLINLNLSGNHITKRGGYAIASMIKENKSLRIIDLSWNKIRDMGILAIIKAIQVSPNIIEANINWNGVKNKTKIKEKLTEILNNNNKK